MGSMKDFVQTYEYSISPNTEYNVSCDTCVYLWQKRIVGRMRNICGLYWKMRRDEVIIPNPKCSTCKCHIEKCR